MTEPTPDRIEWAIPNANASIVMDEDGVHLCTDHSLEQCDMEAAIEIFNAAKAMRFEDHIPAPTPPTQDQLKALSRERQARYAMKAVARTLKENLA